MTAWRKALRASPSRTAAKRRDGADRDAPKGEIARLGPTALLSAPDAHGRGGIWIVVAAVLLALLALMLAPRTSRAEVVDRIAAVVNNEIITEVDVDRALASRGKGAAAAKPDATAHQEVLERMIDEKLFAQIMGKSKIEVSDDDLARAIANVLHQNRMSIDQLRGEIAAKGMSYDEYKKQIENEIRRIKFINQVIGPQVKITDADLRDYYQRNQDRFRGGTSAHIAEIVLSLEGIQTESEMKALSDTALAITAKARRGASFDALARQHSKGPNAAQGGDMGMMNVKDLSPEIAQAIRTLKIGEVSNPILVGNAVVILKLISLPEIASGDFDRMRDQIYAALYDERIEETLAGYLQKERQRAFVEVR